MILDWWLSPELYLRRPPAQYPEYRLDRLLKRKAEEGVKIYICVYKEVTQVRPLEQVSVVLCQLTARFPLNRR